MPTTLPKTARILIVDDDADTLKLLELMLWRNDYKDNMATTDPRQCLPLFSEFKPDLILLDLMMPELGGLEVLKQLQNAIPQGVYLPVVILTADITPESRNKVLQAGAQDFLTKPYDETEVLLRIKNLLQTRALYLDLQHKNERLHTLSQRLINMQETERRHIARELHDQIGQSLTALNINLHNACKLASPPSQGALIEECIGITASALQQARAISRDLRPSMLDELGLVTALGSYVRHQAQRAGLDADFHAEPAAQEAAARLSPDAQIACLRIAQEAVTNITRHAQAHHIEVRLHQNGDALELTICDDGVGFDVLSAQARANRDESMGLLVMEERAQLAGGSIQFFSPSDHAFANCAGATIQASFPLMGANKAKKL